MTTTCSTTEPDRFHFRARLNPSFHLDRNRACASPRPVVDSPRVQLHRTIRALRKLVKPALAGLLAALLLFTTTAAVSHLLHRTLHGNAASPNHNCVICLF